MSVAPDVVSVVLVDDHEVVRRGVAELIDAGDGLVVVGQAGSVAEAQRVIEANPPDVAVIDVRLPDGSGVDVCRWLAEAHGEVRSVVFTSFADDEALIEAAEAGASGFVLKQVRGNELIDVIRRVAEGAQLLDDALVRLARRRLEEAYGGINERLTPQERRVLDLIGGGLSNREIGAELFLAEKTVKNYVSSLLAKLGLGRRTQAAALAVRLDERRRRRFD